jgi:hypothetical protein
MKKIILVVMVSAAAYTLSAQTTVVYKVQPAGPGNTYSVPGPILTNFQTTYPGITVLTWEPMDGRWDAIYTGYNNRIIRVSYSTQLYYLEKGRDVNYKVALPVINTYVPEGVITAAINSYGASLYSITTMRGTNNDVVYQVCLLENATVKTVWMNAESTVFTDIDKIRVNNDK